MEKTKHVPFPFAKRPVCSCGAKMKLAQYKGYYDTFNYWCCDNCGLGDEIQRVKPDDIFKGQFA